MRELSEKPVRKPWSPTRRRAGTLEEQISKTIANLGEVPASGRGTSTRAPLPPTSEGVLHDTNTVTEIVPAESVNVGIGGEPPAPRELTVEERALEAERKEIDASQRKIGRELRDKGIEWIRKHEPSKLTEALAMVREGVKIERDAMGAAPADAKIPNILVLERQRWMTVRN